MKFKIFISSVQSEFAKARLAIAEMVRKDRLLNCFFETFVFEKGAARDRKAKNVYLDAVCHRDYTDSGCVQVMLFKDRLEIINPGTLPRGWTAKDLVRSHDSRPHNELLALAMSWTSYVEKSGSGTTDIVAKCKSWGLGVPEYYPETSDFKTVIWRRGFGPNVVFEPSDLENKGLKKGLKKGPQSWPQSWPQSTDNKILSLLYFSDLSAKELAMRLIVSTQTRSFRGSMARLIDDQLIEHTEAKERSRNQKYRLTKKARRLLLSL